MKYSRATLVAAASLLVTAPAVFAQAPLMTMKSGPAQLTAKDKAFLEADAHGAAYELQLASLAKTEARSPEVRQYAEMIVSDHTKYNQALERLAQQQGIKLPDAPTDQQQAKIRMLRDLNGTAFDRGFVEQAKEINQQDAKRSQQEERTTGNQAIKQFINDFKQVDQKHAQAAQRLKVSGAN